MKRLLCIVVAMFIFVLSGCSSASSPENKDDCYKVNRTGVTEVTGSSQMSDPVKDVVIPKESVEQHLNQIDGLHLQATSQGNAVKGWEYLFTIKYDDRSTTQISLSEEKIKIDEKVYETDLYQSNDFSVYFE